MKNSKKKLFSYFHYDFVKVTGALPALLWARPKIYYPFGKPSKKGPIMVSCNHPTFLDPIMVLLAFPFRRPHSLATKDLFNTKFKAWFFKQMHCIVVDKQNFSLASLHQVVSYLQEGKVVVIFPEGGVQAPDEPGVQAFKSGAVLMANRAKAPILPMYMVKREKWYQRQRMVMGQPIDVAKELGPMPSMQDMNRLTELLREKELELERYYQSLPVYQKSKR